MELVGYEDDEAGNFSGDTRSTRLQSCEVHYNNYDNLEITYIIEYVG